MTLRYSDLTGQSATFQTTYLDLSSGGALPGKRTFNAVAAIDQWADGDQMSIHVRLDDDNWQLWLASWSSATMRLSRDKILAQAGTIATDAIVEARAVLARATLPGFTEASTLTPVATTITVPLDGQPSTVTPSDIVSDLAVSTPGGMDNSDIPLVTKLTIQPPSGDQEHYIRVPRSWVSSPPCRVIRISPDDPPVTIELSTLPNGSTAIRHFSPPSVGEMRLAWWDAEKMTHSKETVSLPIEEVSGTPGEHTYQNPPWEAARALIVGLPPDAVLDSFDNQWSPLDFAPGRHDPEIETYDSGQGTQFWGAFRGPEFNFRFDVWNGQSNFAEGSGQLTATVSFGGFSEQLGPIFYTVSLPGSS